MEYYMCPSIRQKPIKANHAKQYPSVTKNGILYMSRRYCRRRKLGAHNYIVAEKLGDEKAQLEKPQKQSLTFAFTSREVRKSV